MFFDFIATHAPAIVAAVVLVPVLVFSIALFLEGARRTRWPSVRSRSVTPIEPGAPVARRRPQVHGRGPASVMGGAGLRHGIAARRDHD